MPKFQECIGPFTPLCLTTPDKHVLLINLVVKLAVRLGNVIYISHNLHTLIACLTKVSLINHLAHSTILLEMINHVLRSHIYISGQLESCCYNNQQLLHQSIIVVSYKRYFEVYNFTLNIQPSLIYKKYGLQYGSTLYECLSIVLSELFIEAIYQHRQQFACSAAAYSSLHRAQVCCEEFKLNTVYFF